MCLMHDLKINYQSYSVVVYKSSINFLSGSIKSQLVCEYFTLLGKKLMYKKKFAQFYNIDQKELLLI